MEDKRVNSQNAPQEQALGAMLDTVIVGGGLCGLALARRLQEQNRDYAVYEARNRLGGRILSHTCTATDMEVDLGPAWFWPESQPLMARLAADLGLIHFPQYDDGSIHVLSEPDKKPARLENETVHAGAHRLDGSMFELPRALLECIPQDRIHLSHTLTAVAERGDHVELTFARDGGETFVMARRVVLAMPPRLVEEHVYFSPGLDADLLAVMRATPTWMAAQAKAVMAYGAMPAFRIRCGSGNAFVHHEQATLGEIFDASSMLGSKAALGGFLALSPPVRKSFRGGLRMLIASQFAQVFGAGFEEGHLHYQDWAAEPFTCSSQDRRETAQRNPPHRGDPRLQASQWVGKLFFAGTETAATAAGYLEGALDAAVRVERMLMGTIAASPTTNVA